MNAKQIVDYVCEILNVKTDNSLVILDMINDLKEIEDLEGFKTFIKDPSKTSGADYKYLSGYQKFVKSISDYKKQKRDQVVLNNPQIKTFSESLYKKTCDVFDEVNWMVQSGNDIDSDIVKKFIYNNFYGKDKEIQVLKKVGSKQEILNFVKNNKYSLEKKIQEIVTSFTILKHTKSPALEYKDKEVMKRLSNG